MSRERWEDYFLGIATRVATRSTCLRRKVGAVAVNANNRIIGTGYNGAPAGMEHCTHESCIREINHIPSGTQLDLCKAIHAEANIVLQLGDQLKDARIFITNQPCTSCTKLLMGAGIAEIWWMDGYPDNYAMQLMREYGRIISLGYTRKVAQIADINHTGLDMNIATDRVYSGGVLLRKDVTGPEWLQDRL